MNLKKIASGCIVGKRNCTVGKQLIVIWVCVAAEFKRQSHLTPNLTQLNYLYSTLHTTQLIQRKSEQRKDTKTQPRKRKRENEKIEIEKMQLLDF